MSLSRSVTSLAAALWLPITAAAATPPKPAPLGSDEAAWHLQIVANPQPVKVDESTPMAAFQVGRADVTAVQACKDAAMKGKAFPPVPGHENPRSDPKNTASPALQELAWQINNCLAAGGQKVSVVATPFPVSAKFLR